MSEDISKIILEELRAHRRESNERHVSLEKRVRTVEDWQSNARGKITMACLLITVFSSTIAWVIGY